MASYSFKKWPWNQQGILTGGGRWMLARSAGWSLANCVRAFLNLQIKTTEVGEIPSGPSGA